MIDARYFDEENADSAAVDGAVQEMARRQFAMSLAVAFALLAAAALIAVRAPHGDAIAGTTAPHKIAGVQKPHMVARGLAQIVAPALTTNSN